MSCTTDFLMPTIAQDRSECVNSSLQCAIHCLSIGDLCSFTIDGAASGGLCPNYECKLFIGIIDDALELNLGTSPLVAVCFSYTYKLVMMEDHGSAK